jgi:hypothetical protein
MKIGYVKLPDDTRVEGYSYYPFLNIALRYGAHNCVSTSALVDSGSLDTIFPASLGEALGIDITSGQPFGFSNFNFQRTEGFVHKVHLQVTNFPQWIELDVAFIQSEVIPILGQIGFYDNYQIVFERWRRTFEINTKEDAMIRNRRGHGRAR